VPAHERRFGRKVEVVDKPQVLVVDDDLDLREVLGFVLEDSGWEMASCNNGQDALNWLQDHHPRLVLLDLMMPIMSGREFLVAAKKAGLNSTPIVVMSASADLDKEFKPGTYLKKPFDIAGLQELLRHFM